MGTTAPVDGAREQKLRAILVANAVKERRTGLRDRMRPMGREGARLLADAVLRPPRALQNVHVWRLVDYVPRVGESRAEEMLLAARISPWRRLGSLDAKQRLALADQLKRHAAGRPCVDPPARVLPAIRYRVCVRCSEQMRRPTAEGLCGFCVAEAEMVDEAAR